MILFFLAAVGTYALIWYLYDNLKSPFVLFKHVLQRCLGSKPAIDLRKKYGNWAAITGATDGIGKAYARELASQGLNVVLISRTATKLQQLAAEIERDFEVRTLIIVADFSKGREIYAHIERELKDLQVGILVNNVGQNFPGILAALDFEEVWSMICTNMAAMTLLSRFFMRRMHSSGLQGAIVNISSITELQPTPFGALYAASKAFTRSLTISLQSEARPYGITVQLVSPGFVLTKINAYISFVMRGGLFIPDAETYAYYAVRSMGLLDQTSGYFWHGLQVAFMKLFPWQLRTRLSASLLQYLADDHLKRL